MPLLSRSTAQTALSLTKASWLLLIMIAALLLFARDRSEAAPSLPVVVDIAQPEQFDPTAFVENARNTVNGPQHWATLLCKFSDVNDEPQSAAFFNDMFERTSGPSLSDFWQEVSYDNIPTITTDVHGWVSLPHDRSYYNFSDATAGYDVTHIVQDCVDAAPAAVDFNAYDAVAVILNSPSPVAITTLFLVNYPDGALIDLGAITIPSNKYNLALVAHEMGHAYGLPHSFADGVAYQNPWDLMGIASGYRCSVNADPVYGCLGQHTIATYKDYLGWITPAQNFDAPPGESTVTLERLSRPQTNNYLMATISIGGDTFTVEARQRVGYDAKLAGDGIIIHRGNGDDLVDADGGPYDDAGAIWLPGETYTDATTGVSIRVDSATPTGFVIAVNNPTIPSKALSYRFDTSPASPVANDQVDFSAVVTYEDSYLGSTSLVFTATFPDELTYVPDSAMANQGSIVSEDPFVVQVDSMPSRLPLFLEYSATVNGNVTEPTLIQVPVEVQWSGSTISATHTFVANGENVYLPLLVR